MPTGGVSRRTPFAKTRFWIRLNVQAAVLNQTFLIPFVFRFAGLKSVENQPRNSSRDVKRL